MADRRMFAKTIIDSDAFLDMPLSTQALYFHLSMRADDEGFVNSPKKIQRIIGASDDDMKVLIAKRFIIVFESGVIVIKHWKIHNYIRSDRIHHTVYQEEAAMLALKENKAYTLASDVSENPVRQLSVIRQSDVSQASARCQSDVSHADDDLPSNVRLDKNSIGKYSINNNKDRHDDDVESENDDVEDDHTPKSATIYADEFESIWKDYPNKQGKHNALKAFIKARKEGVPLEMIENGLKRYRDHVEGTDKRYIKHGDTWFRGRYWEDDGIQEEDRETDLDDIFM